MSDLVNYVSVDVEDWFQAEAYAHLIPFDQWDSLDLRVEKNTHLLLDLFDVAETKATFFVLGWIAERQPDLIREIVKRGHEVGSHGWSHRPLWRMEPAEFREEAQRSRAFLQDLSGSPVIGFRAPCFSITKNTRWALDMLVESGYQYDSSIFPVHHDRYGIPDAPLHAARQPEGILEIPMSVLNVGSYRLPVAGGGYLRLYPLGLTSYAIHKMNQAGRPAVVYVHPWEFDPGQPTWPGLSRGGRFRHHVGTGRNENKMKALMSGFRFAPMREALAAERPSS